MDQVAQLGWVGLGNMGARMAPRLAGRGYCVTAYDTDRQRIAGLRSQGIQEAASLMTLAAECRFLFTMLPDGAAVHDVVNSLRDHLRPASCFIDMSTISPDSSAAIAAQLEGSGIGYLRAPVSGSTTLAEQGALSILVSGTPRVFDEARPLLEVLGRTVTFLGQAEEARVAKLVVNTVVGALNNAIAEALSLGHRSGLDWETMIDVLASSVVASPYVTSKITKLKDRDWSAAATISLIAKDLDLALELARTRGAFMPATATVRQILSTLEGRGHGSLDMSAVVTFYE